jgi:hypothetical protein
MAKLKQLLCLSLRDNVYVRTVELIGVIIVIGFQTKAAPW